MCEVSQRGEEEIFLIGSFKFMEITLQDAIDDDRSEWVFGFMSMCSSQEGNVCKFWHRKFL